MASAIEVGWRANDRTGLEHCRIDDTADGIVVRSAVIGEHDGVTFGAFYEIQLDRRWLFRSLVLRRTDGRVLRLVSNGEGDWKIDGQRAPRLEGCVDVDISATPFTNTLPIRRAVFATGLPQHFDMAWVSLDTLVPQRDGQIYTRIDATHFLYEAADGSFSSLLEVDDGGLVVSYPGKFSRL